MTIELAYRDRELAELVRNELAPNFPLRKRLRPNGSRMVVFAITSRQLFSDLGELGVTPRKSLTLEWPRNLEGDLTRFFLLGYFDRDGFTTWSRHGRYRSPRWGLLGTHPFLADAMTVIAEATEVRRRVIRRRPDSKIHSFYIGGRDALTVDEWLHADTKLGLARKRLRPPVTGA